MDTTVRVTIRVRKYLWSEFVHDVCFVLYGAIVISNALCKRWFRLSIPQLYHRIRDPIVRAGQKVDEVGKKIVLIILVVFIGIFALAYTIMVPTVFILGSMGKIQ